MNLSLKFKKIVKYSVKIVYVHQYYEKKGNKIMH